MRLAMSVVVLLSVLFCQQAMACGPEVEIRFTEASPDRFLITFTRGPKLSLIGLKIDLGRSAAGAFFDGNDGLEMQDAQPNAQGVSIRSVSYDHPNGTLVTLTFENFTEGRSVNFASDLDDRGLSNDPDQNHINEGELLGATAAATLIGSDGRRIEIDGRFDKQGRAQLGDKACV